MRPVFDSTGLATESGNLRCFYYDPFSREYAGYADEFIPIGVSLPGHSTAIVPGAEIAGYARVFTGENWSQLADHRGTLAYSTIDGTPSIVDYIGDIKAGFVADKPATPYDVWGDGGWVTDNQKLRSAQVAEAEQKKSHLLSIATEKISILQDAVDMDMATPEETAALTAWKKFRVLLNRTDTTVAPDVNWPESPDSLPVV